MNKHLQGPASTRKAIATKGGFTGQVTRSDGRTVKVFVPAKHIQGSVSSAPLKGSAESRAFIAKARGEVKAKVAATHAKLKAQIHGPHKIPGKLATSANPGSHKGNPNHDSKGRFD